MFKRFIKEALYCNVKDVVQFVYPEKRVLAIYGGPEVVLHHCRHDNMIFLTIPDPPKDIKMTKEIYMNASVHQIPRP